MRSFRRDNDAATPDGLRSASITGLSTPGAGDISGDCSDRSSVKCSVSCCSRFAAWLTVWRRTSVPLTDSTMSPGWTSPAAAAGVCGTTPRTAMTSPENVSSRSGSCASPSSSDPKDPKDSSRRCLRSSDSVIAASTRNERCSGTSCRPSGAPGTRRRSTKQRSTICIAAAERDGCVGMKLDSFCTSGSGLSDAVVSATLAISCLLESEMSCLLDSDICLKRSIAAAVVDMKLFVAGRSSAAAAMALSLAAADTAGSAGAAGSDGSCSSKYSARFHGMPLIGSRIAIKFCRSCGWRTSAQSTKWKPSSGGCCSTVRIHAMSDCELSSWHTKQRNLRLSSLPSALSLSSCAIELSHAVDTSRSLLVELSYGKLASVAERTKSHSDVACASVLRGGGLPV
eukprot:Unigene8512_Nuclearia_a/m.26065 Unigene8512_Nuclearia_a/g.26065  ORF Unigene8512_Nuclearia_a/g.26065 Unigene8512_Nuclearia_a/m.26065 type:complete len:398 (+) Unigene8512_Nuclearia_a:416-1609(+)